MTKVKRISPKQSILLHQEGHEMVCLQCCCLLIRNLVLCSPPQAYLELLQSRVSEALISSHCTGPCLPVWLPFPPRLPSIHLTKLLSTCYMPSAVPSAGHQAGHSWHLVAPWGTLGPAYVGLLSHVTLSLTTSQIIPPSIHLL